MHQIDSFCALACAPNDYDQRGKTEFPLETPVEAPLAMSPRKPVVEMPATMKPEDAVATAADAEMKGRVIPAEQRTELFAGESQVAKLQSQGETFNDKRTDVPRIKDVAAAVEKEKDLDKQGSGIAKTSLCSYFRSKGCKHGESCKFAHGESELQQRPDGSWDPTSERCKKPVEKKEDEDGESRYRKCLVNVPMNWSQQKLKSFLDENGVSYTSAQKRKSMKVCFLGFRSQEELTKSAEILDGMSVSNKRLKLADVLPRAWEQKAVGVTESALAGCKEEENNGEDHAMAEDGGSGDENEKKTLEPYRNVTQVVTPLAHLPYEEQLAKKKEEIIQVLKRLARNIRKGCPAGMLLPDWLAAAKDREGLPCKFEGILPSPVVDGYRNKCEFAIGLGPDGKQRVVGFQLGSFREGINAIAEPGDCQNVSKVALRFVSAFQTFIRASRLPVWNKTDNTGFWRMLTIREGREPGSADEIGKEIAEVMLVVQVCPTGVPEERASAEYTMMEKVLIEAASSHSPPLPLTALLVQEHVGVSNSAPADCPLKALPLTCMDDAESPRLVEPAAHIHDYIGTSKFRISPTAFFQVNSAGAEKLYSLAGDWAGLGPDTLLFDVCCGTGAIGLTLAKKVGMVVGIEMNASAVADAQLNADLNGIKNCRFICGKAEDVISNLLKEYAVEDDDEKISEPEAGIENGNASESEADGKISEPEADGKSSEPEADGVVSEPEADGIISEPEADGKVSEEQVTTTTENGQQEATKRRFKNIVAIVDPPRVGLHHVVLRTLRLHSKLKRVVYISCNPDSLLANAVELCMPIKEGPVEKQKQRGGFRGSNLGHARRRVKTLPPSEPFHPVRACAVDLFPHTKHCEMVMLFER